MSKQWTLLFNSKIKELSIENPIKRVYKVFKPHGEIDVYRLQGGEIKSVISLFFPTVLSMYVFTRTRTHFCYSGSYSSCSSPLVPDEILKVFKEFKILYPLFFKRSYNAQDIKTLADKIYSFKSSFINVFPSSNPKFTYSWVNFDSRMYISLISSYSDSFSY